MSSSPQDVRSADAPFLPADAFDALFRATELEERVEFQACDPTYDTGCVVTPPPVGPPVMTVTPEPATMALSAAGLGALGVGRYLKRRAERRRAEREATTER